MAEYFSGCMVRGSHTQSQNFEIKALIPAASSTNISALNYLPEETHRRVHCLKVCRFHVDVGAGCAQVAVAK